MVPGRAQDGVSCTTGPSCRRIPKIRRLRSLPDVSGRALNRYTGAGRRERIPARPAACEPGPVTQRGRSGERRCIMATRVRFTERMPRCGCPCDQANQGTVSEVRSRMSEWQRRLASSQGQPARRRPGSRPAASSLAHVLDRTTLALPRRVGNLVAAGPRHRRPAGPKIPRRAPEQRPRAARYPPSSPHHRYDLR